MLSASDPSAAHARDEAPRFATLVEMLRFRARVDGERRACTLLVDGETREEHLTYAELDRRARAIAALLQASSKPGQRAILLYAPDFDFLAAFLGCLYAGAVAVPAYPPDPARLRRTLPRLLAIVRDSQAELVLTTSAILPMAE